MLKTCFAWYGADYIAVGSGMRTTMQDNSSSDFFWKFFFCGEMIFLKLFTIKVQRERTMCIRGRFILVKFFPNRQNDL